MRGMTRIALAAAVLTVIGFGGWIVVQGNKLSYAEAHVTYFERKIAVFDTIARNAERASEIEAPRGQGRCRGLRSNGRHRNPSDI